jgi:hypothetical protein
MDPMTDPSVMALPHPVRLEAATGTAVDSRILGHAAPLAELRPILIDETTPTEALINIVPGLHDLAVHHFGVFSGQGMGTFILILTRGRLRAHGDPILKVAPTLQGLLAESDLDQGLPSRFFRAPYPLAYVEFARPNPWRLPNRQSGLHECEGVYVGSYQLPAGHPMLANPVRNRALKLDPNQPARAIELVITGSPAGKAHAADDASQNLLLLIQDEDECLNTVLERHIAFYNDPAAYSSPGMMPLDAAEMRTLAPIVSELAKVLVYLNLPEAELVPTRERTDLERRLKGRGPKKAARLKRQLGTAYDHILVGPSVEAEHEAASARSDTGEPGAQVRPHWRRGHFRRVRHGEGRSEMRMAWIKPVLVNGSGIATGAVKTKPYMVH